MINPTKETYEIDGKIVTASEALDTVFECLDADREQEQSKPT
jgi:hypothetical protein